MPRFNIACQTVTWGDSQETCFPAIFSACRENGYQGVEISFRHLAEVPTDILKGMLAAAGLQLVATHVGENLERPAKVKTEHSVLDRILTQLHETGVSRLIFSGLRYESENQFSQDIAKLNRAAERCAACGVQMLYHNHDWEFQDDALVMTRLLKEGSDQLGLCPDIGWMAKAGVDPVTFLAANRTRIGAVHFKDFATLTPGLVDTVILGQGVVPLRETAAWLQNNWRVPLWIIAEQDQAEEGCTSEATCRANAAFLKNLFKQLPPAGA
jgi:sugar phosphate isomerase/epimerase